MSYTLSVEFSQSPEEAFSQEYTDKYDLVDDLDNLILDAGQYEALNISVRWQD